MSKNPPPYSDTPPGWTPAQSHQPGVPPPGGAQPSHTVVVTNLTSRPITAVGPDPVRVICPSCRAEVLTTMKSEPTTKTHLIALCLFCFMSPAVYSPTCTVLNVSVGPDPARMNCPYCGSTVLTEVHTSPNWKTHMTAMCLCCLICWPCVCLPYCMDSCQNANHYCPNCNAFIGTYQN